jgi:hypothetical protein
MEAAGSGVDGEGLIKMANKHEGSILKEARELMKDKELSKALSGLIEKKRGALGFLLGILKKRPSIFTVQNSAAAARGFHFSAGVYAMQNIRLI